MAGGEEEVLFKAKAMNEADRGRRRSRFECLMTNNE